METKNKKDSLFRTLVKTLSYRTFVAISIFIATILLNYPAGFGLKFIILTYTLGYVCFLAQERIWNMIQW